MCSSPCAFHRDPLCSRKLWVHYLCHPRKPLKQKESREESAPAYEALAMQIVRLHGNNCGLRIGGESVRCHRLAQSFLSVGAPVAAVEADEDRRIRNRQRGLEYQNVERLTRFIEFGDDFFVRQRLRLIFREQITQRLAISRHSSGVV